MSNKNSIEQLTQHLKGLKAEKGQIARQFKLVARDSDEFLMLKSSMQDISEKLKATENQIKALRKATAESQTAQTTIDKTPLPAQFLHSDACLNGTLVFSWHSQESIPNDWWTFLANQPSSFYHQQAFGLLLKDSLAIDIGIYIAENEKGEIVGGIPLHITDSRIFGHFATSIPHVNYGGPISSYVDVREALLAKMPDLCKELKLSNIQIRCTEKLGDWPASEKKVSMLRELPLSQSQLDKEMGTKVRAQAKKALQVDPEIKFGGVALLDDFYKVFSQNMRDLGTPVYAKEWFLHYLSAFEDSAEVCVAYIQQQPVSCGFLVYNKDFVEIPWASTLRKANKFDMNMWMYHQILNRCITKKYRWFDFGRSTRDAGTYKFKRQWRAQEFQHYWYDASPQGFEVREGLNPDNPKFKLAISVWQRLPLVITNIIGPLVAKDLV